MWIITIVIGIVALLAPKLVVLMDNFIIGSILKSVQWPDLNDTVTYALGEIQYKLHNFQITDFRFDQSRLIVQKSTVNRLQVCFKGLKLKLEAGWEYNGTKLFQGTDSGNLTVEVSKNTLNFSISLIQSGKLMSGNIMVSKCAVQIGSVQLNIEKKQSLFYDTLTSYAKNKLHEFLKDSTCSKIKEKIEKDGNALLWDLEKIALKLVIIGDKYVTIAQMVHWLIMIFLLFFSILISLYGIGFLFLLMALFCLNLLLFSTTCLKRLIDTGYRSFMKKNKTKSSARGKYVLPSSRKHGAKFKTLKVS